MVENLGCWQITYQWQILKNIRTWKNGGWETTLSFQEGLFPGAMLVLREGRNEAVWPILLQVCFLIRSNRFDVWKPAQFTLKNGPIWWLTFVLLTVSASIFSQPEITSEKNMEFFQEPVLTLSSLQRMTTPEDGRYAEFAVFGDIQTSSIDYI